MINYGLGIHTCTGELGLSISNFQQDAKLQSWDLGKDLSNYLHQYLVEFIKPKSWQQIEFIAVAKGPGSFTSNRIGIVTAKTLAQQLNIPVYGISTLASLAFNVKNDYELGLHLAIEMSASRGQLFVGIYEYSINNNLIIHLEDTLIPPEKWTSILSDYPAKYQLIKCPDNLGYTVGSLLDLAYITHQQNQQKQLVNWQDLTPFYGQNPIIS